MATRNAKRAGASKSTAGKVPPTRATGEGSATGTQLREQTRKDIPKGKDRGSRLPIEGGQPPADYIGDPGKPRGLQAEEAMFTSNGQIPSGTVPTNSGPVPVSAVASSPEDAKRRLEELEEAHAADLERRERGELSEDEVRRMGRAELRAIGERFGYELPEAGTRATREAFLQAQAKRAKERR